MTQPIDREKLHELAIGAGALLYDGYIFDGSEELDNFYQSAVAHSRKDAEPVEYQYRSKPSWEKNWLPWERCTKDCYLDYAKAPLLHDWQYEARALYIHPPEADKPINKLTGCACRWDENDNRVLTCVRHQGWLDVVEEWATTAKENQAVIDRLTSKRQEAEPNTKGTDYVSDAEFNALIAELQSITEEARATDYHDALRKAMLFLNLLKSKVHKYAKDIVRLDAACAEQHAAYTSAHSRLNEADKLLQQALEALDNSVDTVREEYTEAVRRYSGLPSRKARLDALNSLLTKHEASIAAIRTYLENKA